MEALLVRYSFITRHLRVKRRVITAAEIKLLFDDIITFINEIAREGRRNDCMSILTIVCDDLASLNSLRLFDHIILRNHSIFLYIGRTLEMLLTKSNRSQTVRMTKEEEECLYSASYLMAQLCLYQNEIIDVFYGKVPTEVFPVTGKPNPRDENINKNRRKSEEIMEKPNLKVARLPPNAPIARPFEERQPNIVEVIRKKKCQPQFIPTSNETTLDHLAHKPNQVVIAPTKYQDIFLTASFLDKVVRAIDDLSQNEYSPYHVRYKVVDRLVRLCSKLGIVDVLLDSVVKCLCSKFYRQAFETIKSDQIRLTPKQLFFIYQCPQFIIQNQFAKQKEIPSLLCKALIDVTKSIFDKHFSATDIEIDSNENGDRRIAMLALSCHIEFLYYLSLTSSGRQYFLQNSIVNQMLLVLRQHALIYSSCEHEYLFHADVSIIAYTLMLLCNLAYERQIFLILKQTDLKDICSQLHSAKDNTIQFASQTLITILNQESIDENNEPGKLREAYIKFLESIIVETKQETSAGVTRNIKEREDNTKHVFLKGSFLEKLIENIGHLSIYEYQPNEQRYKEAAQQIRVCSKEETNDVEKLLDPIIDCLSSTYYFNVYKKISINQVKVSKSNLAAKQLFFMRDCSEFLIRHDYKRQDEVASSLCKKMLDITETIFEQYLPVVIGTEDGEDTSEKRNARIEALSYHIRLLNHFALTPSTRKEFVETTIIDEILSLLHNDTLVDRHGRIASAKIVIIGQSLTLLYNLAFDKQILSTMKTKNVLTICLKMRSETDKTVQFTSQALSIMLDPNITDDIPQPNPLTKTYVEYMDKSVKEPRQPYHGVKLQGVLKSLEMIIQNDAVQERIVEEKDGLSSLTKCVRVECEDNPTLNALKKIQRSSLNIIWKLLFFGPTATKKLKTNDMFIDHLLILLTGPSQKLQRTAKSIIWKLGNEETFRSEQAEKQKEREQESHKEQKTRVVDDQAIANNQWDDSVPFGLMISFSNDLNVTSLCHKIRNRLITKKFKVYIEQQGKQRLEKIQKAVEKRTIILVCLSTKYRASKVCMAEVEHAFKHKCPIIPVIVEANYKVKGWLKHLVGNKNAIDFTQKNFNDAILKLIVEIEEIKASDEVE